MIDGFDAMIVLGGPTSVYKDHQYLRDEETLIKEAIAKNIPTLGICLGSQLLAKATGGRVYKGPRKEIGWYTIELTNDGMKDIFNGLKKCITVFQWHGDTYDLPKGAVTLCKSELHPVQAFRVGCGLGVQFHGEVSKDMVLDWILKYKSELESVHNYINEVVTDLTANVNTLNEYAGILY